MSANWLVLGYFLVLCIEVAAPDFSYFESNRYFWYRADTKNNGSKYEKFANLKNKQTSTDRQNRRKWCDFIRNFALKCFKTAAKPQKSLNWLFLLINLTILVLGFAIFRQFNRFFDN